MDIHKKVLQKSRFGSEKQRRKLEEKYGFCIIVFEVEWWKVHHIIIFYIIDIIWIYLKHVYNFIKKIRFGLL